MIQLLLILLKVEQYYNLNAYYKLGADIDFNGEAISI